MYVGGPKLPNGRIHSVKYKFASRTHCCDLFLMMMCRLSQRKVLHSQRMMILG